MGDIRAHQNLGRGKCPSDLSRTGYSPSLDFPTMTFLSQLYALARSIAAHVADVHPGAIYFVSRSRLDDASRKVESLKVSFEDEMKACHIAKLKPPKRLASFAETSPSKYVVFNSFCREHVAHRISRTSTPRPKKLRLSPSDGSLTDEEMTSPGSPSPPLSISTSAPSEPTHHTLVTPAMLRSLTKEIRAKYGAAGPNALSASVSR